MSFSGANCEERRAGDVGVIETSSYHSSDISQNRDTRAPQLKLDELIRSSAGARDQLINLEGFDDEKLDALEDEFQRIRKQRSRLPK